MVDNLPCLMALWYFWSIYSSICRWGRQWGGWCWCGDKGSSEASISANHWGQDQTSYSLQKEGWEAVIAFCVDLSSLDPAVLQPPWLLKVLPSYWSSAWASPTFYVHQFCRTQENNDPFVDLFHLSVRSTQELSELKPVPSSCFHAFYLSAIWEEWVHLWRCDLEASEGEKENLSSFPSK